MTIGEIILSIAGAAGVVSAAVSAYVAARAKTNSALAAALSDAGLNLASLARLERETKKAAARKRDSKICVVTNSDENTPLQTILFAAHFQRVAVCHHNDPEARIFDADVVVFDGWLPAYDVIARAMGCGEIDEYRVPRVVVYSPVRVELKDLAPTIVCANSLITVPLHVDALLRLQSS